MSIKSELLKLQSKDGLLYPEKVHQWAQQNPKSELHKSLEWDDAKAGHEYRLYQIRKLIAVNIVTAEGKRQMVSLSVDRVNAGGYREINAVLEHEGHKQVMLDDAFAELERVRAKYEHFVELVEVWNALNKAKAKAEAKKAKKFKQAAE